MSTLVVKPATENIKDSDDSWLYGTGGIKAEEINNEKNNVPELVQNGETKAQEEDRVVDGVDEPGTPINAVTAEGDEEDSDDDIQVTIGDINAAPYESKFKNVYQQQRPTAMAPIATAKPPPKGVVDMDAVGSINGVPVYEYDIDSLKLEDKPWRKPGADNTDYFNYGFNEDTWSKYCERQRRLRMENNPNKHSNNAFYAPIHSIEHSMNQAIPKIESGGGLPRQIGQIPIRSSVIDVIGGHTSTTRRLDVANSTAQEFQQISSVSNVIPISMSLPPPMMNMHLPDFAHPPPGAQMQSRPITTPMQHPPPGMISQIIVGPPAGYPGIPMPGGYYRQNIITAPLQIQHDKRVMGAFPGDRPPYRFDASFPPPFQPPHVAPPGAFIQRVDGFSGERPPGMEGAPAWPLKSDDDISSSGDENNRAKDAEKSENRDQRMHYDHPSHMHHRPRIHHDMYRSRADERSRERSHERRDTSEHHSRSRDQTRERTRDYDRRHHRDRDERRHHSSKRRDSREVEKSRSKHKKSSKNQLSESESSDSGK